METHYADSVESDKSLMHELGGQFNESLCYLCRTGTVAAFLSLTQKDSRFQ